MKKLKQVIAFTLLLFLAAPFAEVANHDNDHLEKWDAWSDIKKSFQLMFEGSYKQFYSRSSLAIGGIGAVGLAYTFHEDDRLMLHYKKTGVRTLEKRISNDWSVVTNFPTIPITSYLISWKTQNNKLKNFSMEYFASMYLAMIESAGLSLLPIHDRPSSTQLTEWETIFRSDSSFPSGHILGMSTLFFKTLQYYGPLWAIAPGAVTYLIAHERMASQKHYPSDIWGGLILSALASEGTKIANQNNTHKHWIYKWIYEHEVSFLVNPAHKMTTLSLNMTF